MKGTRHLEISITRMKHLTARLWQLDFDGEDIWRKHHKLGRLRLVIAGNRKMSNSPAADIIVPKTEGSGL